MSALDSIWDILNNILLVAGLWGLFRKLNVRGWIALIPGVRLYALAKGIDREEEGRTLILTEILIYLGSIAFIILGYTDIRDTDQPLDVTLDDKRAVILIAAYLCVLLVGFVYKLRLYIQLCRVFGRKKWWIILMIAAEGITFFVWGWSKKFMLQETAADHLAKGVAVSDITVQPLEKGLTVNIKERSVGRAIFKKSLLKDIHLGIKPGRMVLLLGGSGAGKTTFVNALTGYEKADAQILLDGHDVYSEYDKMKYRIGFVPQQDLMRGCDSTSLTLLDAAYMRLSSKFGFIKRRERVREVLDEFGLMPVRNNLVDKLSGGQRKRLSIAIEYISDPGIFILDEPDSGIDGIMARRLFEKLREIADKGKIVIVITHTPDRVIELFDDVIVLAKDSGRTGRLAYFGTVDGAREFFGKNTMEEILLTVNQKDEGGEGRAGEYVKKYAETAYKEAI